MSLNIVPEAIFPPATCIVTGSPSGPFVDCIRAIPGYGRVYISVAYLRSVVPGLGFVPAPELATALEEQDALVTRVEHLEQGAKNTAADVLEAVVKGAVEALRGSEAE